MKTPSCFIRIVISAITLFTAQWMRAGTDIWTGAGGSDNLFWLSTANWQSASLPQEGDQLVFTNTVGLLNSNNYPAGQIFGGITFATPAGAFILNGNRVTLTNNITDLQPITPQTVNLPITVNSPNSLTINEAANAVLNLNNVISGTGGLTNNGPGIVYLNGNNTFAGPLVINAGTMAVTRTNNLGAAPVSPTPGNIVLNGGALETMANIGVNTNRGIALGPTSGSGSGILSVDSATTLTNGSIMADNGGTGGLTKIGFGNLILFGANTYSGPTTNTIGTMFLDYTRSTAPANNIINSASKLTMGGGNAGPLAVNYALLTIAGKGGTVQTFNNSHFTYGASLMLVTNLTGSGVATLNLGNLTHNPGGTLTVGSSTPISAAAIKTTSPNVNGILGGWALIGGVNNTITAGQTVNGYPVYTGTNFATVDVNGNIVDFNNYYVYNNTSQGTLHDLVDGNVTGVETNVLADTSVNNPLVVRVDTNGAARVTDINAIKFYNNNAALHTGDGIFVGTNNTLRLGVYGGMLFNNGSASGATMFIGGTNEVVQGNSTNAHNNSGFLTAGGPNNNTDGEIVVTVYGNSESSGTVRFETQIVDNGSGKVSFVKQGPGSIKLDSHNSFSGGLYLLTGRVQFTGLEDGNPEGNPDGGGTGPIYVFPGCYLFPSGLASTNFITNAVYVAGIGDAQENLGALRGGNFSGPLTMIGDTTLGGNANVVGPISGPFTLTIGSKGVVNGGATLGGQGNNWTGDLILLARTNKNGAFNNVFTSGTNDVVPNGFGYGNVLMLASNTTTAATISWDMNGFSETINGLSSLNARIDGFGQANIGQYTYNGQVPTCLIFNGDTNGNVSTLTIGDNNQSGVFGGVISTNRYGVEGTNSLGGYDPVGVIGLTKIGAGVETFTNMSPYTGDTVISNGVLQMAVLGSIPNSTVYIKGGSLDVSPIAGYSFGNSQVINTIGGTLFVSTATSSAGTINFTNGTLKVTGLNSANANLTAPTVNFDGTTNVIQPANIPLIPAYPATFPIVHYTSALGGSFSTVGLSLPGGGFPPFAGYLSNDTATSTIYLVLTTGPVTPQLTWVGFSSGTYNSIWDFVANDWTNIPAHTAASYTDGSLLIFDDSGRTNVVSLNADFFPAGVTIANTNVNYTFVGAGGIHGTNAMTKVGTGSAVFDNGGTNDFSGGLTIGAGVVQVGRNDANGSIGTGAIADNGTIVFNRSDSIAVANNISGTGGLLVSNGAASSVQLSGNNSYGGSVYVVSGVTLLPAANTALGSTNGATTLAGGATLDVSGPGLAANALNLGGEPVSVSGVGDGSGAIINSGANAQQNVLQRVTLAGNTTFGGASRWDIRGTGASLNTGGNAYNLIKAGANQVSLVGAAVDPALADVDVQNGILSLETTTTGLGNSSANLFVRSGATLQVYQLTNQLNKNISMDVGSLINSGSGNNTIIGPITINGTAPDGATFTGAGTSTLTLSGTMSGGGRLIKDGTNTLILAGTDNRTGDTLINNGTFILNGTQTGTAGLYAAVPTLSAPTILGGNGTNAGSVIVDNVFEPGIGGTPSTFGAGSFQAGFYASPVSIFNLGSLTTTGSGVNDFLNVTGDLNGNGNVIQIHPLGLLSTVGSYTLAKCGGTLTAFNATAIVDPVFGPARYQFSLTQGSGLVQLSVTTGAGALRWNNAAGNGIWDVTNSFNWFNTVGGTNDYFAPLDTVLLDNSIIASGVTNVISISTNNPVNPSLITVDSTTNYVINGPGKISGFASIYKTNSSTLTINSTNDFTGATTIRGGTVLVSDPSNLGAVPGGAVIITNTGTLDIGANTTASALHFTNSAGDIKQIYVSGWGVNSNGAIVNSGSVQQLNAFQSITLTADAAFGGPGVAQLTTDNPGRWDMRGVGPVTLSTGGHAYNLNKVGLNQVSLVGTTVDPALADIHIYGGEFGVETTTSPTLGNPNNTITVEQACSFEMFNFAGPLNKKMVVYGGSMLNNSNRANIWFNSNTGGTNNIIISTVVVTNGVVTIGGDGSGTFSNVVSGNGGVLISGGVTLGAVNTYTGNTTVSNNGTLFLTNSASIATTPVINLQGGTVSAVGLASGTLALNGGSGQTLMVTGPNPTNAVTTTSTINGSLTNTAGATVSLAPNSTNFVRLSVTTNATLLGKTVLKLYSGGNTNDVLAAGNQLAIGGDVTITNVSPTALSAGQSFKLFNASTYVTNYTSLTLPLLGPNLAWTNGLAVDGRIGVVSTIASPPVITSISLSGTMLTFTATNGAPGGQYALLQSTNVSLPLAQWTPLFTNNFNGSGNINLSTNVVNSGDAQEFYLLKLLP